MKRIATCAAVIALLLTIHSTAFAQGTAFTYQGRLNSGGAVVTGLYDIIFSVATNTAGGTLQQSVTNASVAVTNGLFTTIIDFGGMPDGLAYWLDLAVRPNGGGAYTTLTPRQPILPTPYAMFANTASNLSGTVSAAQLPQGVVTNNATGVTLDSVTLTGNLNLSGLPVTINSGGSSLLHADGHNNFFAGPNAGNLTTSGFYNTANGDGALEYNTTGFYNTASGFQALSANTTGSYNTASGDFALGANTTGSYNTASGLTALGLNSTGYGNTANGYSALYDNTNGIGNTANGYQALYHNTTGNYNIALGFLAGDNLTTGNNNIDIGNQGVAGESGIIRIGTPGTQTATYLSGNVYANGTFNNTSDRNVKTGFQAVDAQGILAKVAALPITRWQYTNDLATPHVGPMAQDFYAAFAVGPDDKHITTIDESGVALAAIQGLNEKLEDGSKEMEVRSQRLEAENAELKQQNDSLATRMNELETMVKQLTAAKKGDQ